MIAPGFIDTVGLHMIAAVVGFKLVGRRGEFDLENPKSVMDVLTSVCISSSRGSSFVDMEFTWVDLMGMQSFSFPLGIN